MSVRIKFLASAAIAAMSLTLTAQAQISSSGPLGGVNPWGVGWLGSNEHALPSDFWGDSRKSDLTPLFQSISPDRLSPAELMLLKRVLMSSSKAPEGDSDEMIHQRIRLLNAIGGEDKVLDLYRRFPAAEWARPVDEIEVDQDLTAGENSNACAAVNAATELVDFWLRARIACLVMADDLEGAQLAAELARSSGVDDPWLFSIVDSLQDETDARPPARFDTGIATAISLSAGLVPPVNGFSDVSPYRATIIAQRKDAPDMVRVMATQRAAISGGLTPEAERAALIPRANTSEEESEPTGLRTPLQDAVASVANPEIDLAGKAKSVDRALATAEKDPRIFQLHARALNAEISSIPVDYTTIAFAPRFIRAFISNNDLERARKWRAAMDQDLRPAPPEPTPAPVIDGPTVLDPMAEAPPEPVATPEPEPTFEPLPDITFSDEVTAGLDALLALAGDDSAIRQSRLTASTLAGATKKSDASRLLYLMNGMGLALPAEARQMLADERRSNPRESTPINEAATQMDITASSGAIGEAMMHAIHVLRMDREGQRDAIAVAHALDMLRTNGQADIAREAALEAAGLWSAD